MNKILKITGIVILIVLILLAGAGLYLRSRPVAPSDYQKTTETGGEIEKKYLADGPYEVQRTEQPVLQDFKKYTLYYPSELETSSESWPVIVVCNGSGTPISKYPAVPEHYASWGFIVIGTEEEYAWDGFGAEMCARHLERLNAEQQLEENKPNLFFGKIDLSRMGIVGHSQGGVGVINAITAQPHHDMFKTAVSLSPTNQQLAHQIEWDYDAGLIDIPILLISGEGGGDDWVVTGEQLKAIYNEIPAEKFMMRRMNTVHNEVLYRPDGYIMAWFMWQLQQDDEAAMAFTGSSPEVLRNSLYTDAEGSDNNSQEAQANQ